MSDFRLLEMKDYKEYIKLLKQLTKVGDISEKDFKKQLEIMRKSNIEIYILEEKSLNVNNKNIIGAGTLFIEPKIIHNCSFVGHIEDIVIDKNKRKNGHGKKIISFLRNRAIKIKNCYKVILNCSQENMEFYEKCGFRKTGSGMSFYK